MSGPLFKLNQLDCEKWSKPDPSELPPIRFVPCPTTKRQVLTKVIYKDDRKDSTFDIQVYNGLGPLEELFQSLRAIHLQGVGHVATTRWRAIRSRRLRESGR